MWEIPAGGDGESAQLGAQWLRRRYVVVGDYIQPVIGGATEKYDPFDHYYPTGAGGKKDRSWYLDLVELDTDSPEAIERFCSHWGLLGLFQHNALQIRLIQGRPEGSEPPETLEEWLEADFCGDLEETFYRPGGQVSWTSHPLVENATDGDILSFISEPQYFHQVSELQREGLDDVKTWLVKLGEAAFREDGFVTLLSVSPSRRHEIERWSDRRAAEQCRRWLRGERFPYGSVLRIAEHGAIREIDIREYYATYLPDPRLRAAGMTALPGPPRNTPEERRAWREWCKSEATEEEKKLISRWYEVKQVPYPSPQLDQFWDGLCEPLQPFRAAVKAFQEGYDLCQTATADGRLKGHASRVHRLFNNELTRVHPYARWDYKKPEEWTEGWSFPSLLSVAYTCLFLDFVTQNRRPGKCQNPTCGKPFVTHRRDRKFCSPACKNVQSQRTFRAKPRNRSERPT